MPLTTFAERMKQARTAAGMKQNELAKAVGVTPATISAYEKASTEGTGKNPTLENAQKIARILGVSLDWICGNGQSTPDDVTDFSMQDYLKSIAIVLYEMSVETEYKKEKKQAEIYIKNPEMAFFCNQVQNLLAVYRNGTLTTDMYNDCIKRLISGFTKEHCFLFGNILKHGEAVDAEEFFMTILENDPHGTGAGEYEVAVSDYYDKFDSDHYRDVTLLITQEDLPKYKGQELTSDDETNI